MDKELLKMLIANGGAMTKAQILLAMGLNVNSLRTNATLRKDEWVQMDTAIVEAAQDRLVGVADVLGRGLRYTIANGLGKTVLESETVGDMLAAEVSMDGVTRARNDAVVYELVGLPLPLIHKEYQISIRKLWASRNLGEPLDTTQARLSARKVADTQEGMLFNGYDSFQFADYVIYGLCDFPYRNSVTMSKDWASTATGPEIVADVLAMKQASIDDLHYGPWMLYVPTNFETRLDEDYSDAKGEGTVRDRILKITGILGVKVADKLTSSYVVLVQMTEDVVRIVEGMPLTNVEWEAQGSMIFHFKVMTISVPQIRADQNQRSGVVLLKAA